MAKKKAQKQVATIEEALDIVQDWSKVTVEAFGKSYVLKDVEVLSDNIVKVYTQDGGSFDVGYEHPVALQKSAPKNEDRVDSPKDESKDEFEGLL